MKTCTRCKESKSLDCFYSYQDARRKSRTVESYCKECRIKLQRIRKGSTRIVRTQEEITSHVLGPLPSTNEVSIYFVRNILDGVIVYVGKTTNPKDRSLRHRKYYGDVQLVVLKNVNPDDALYWECRHIVEFLDAGHPLTNFRTPEPRN